MIRSRGVNAHAVPIPAGSLKMHPFSTIVFDNLGECFFNPEI